MKNLKFLFIPAFLFFLFGAAAQDTLRNIPSYEALFAYPQDSANLECGYLTGQGCLFGELLAEKYYIQGDASVTGVVSYHEANIQNPFRQLSFEIYSVGNNMLPDQLLGSQSTSYRNIAVRQKPFSVRFSEPIPVADSFFVACNFLDYAHEPLTDFISILSSGHDSISPSNYGRNALRVHHYEWTDLFSRIGLNVNLALFPIIEFPVINDVQERYISTDDFSLYAPYPNPCSNYLDVAFKAEQDLNLSIKIVDGVGKVYHEQIIKSAINGKQINTLDISSLPIGAYAVILSSPNGMLLSKFIKQ